MQPSETPLLPPDATLEETISAALKKQSHRAARKKQSQAAIMATVPVAERVQAVREHLAARSAVNRQWREQAIAPLRDEEQFYVSHALAVADRAGANLSTLQLGIVEQFLA